MNPTDLPLDPAALAAPFRGASWRDVTTRRDALPALGAHVLLHAGPPFHDLPPAPVRQAAVQAILFEGLAADAAGAQALLAIGEVELRPAQDHGVVTPLAQVVSASMPMAVVGDAHRTAFAPLVEGPPPALRFGTTDPRAITRLREIARIGCEKLSPLLRARPVDLAEVIARATAQGDECHGRTAAANAALLEAMPGLDAAERALLSGNASFVLTVLMGAARWVLQGRRHGIACVGGNGNEFGVRLHGELHWRRLPARPPRGTRFPGYEITNALGAIGDSAVLDFCGLGGQALEAAPTLCNDWRQLLPDDLGAQRHAVVDPVSGLVEPLRIATRGQLPIVNLAILDLAGEAGLIGRGFYSPDAALFQPE